ncbi:carbohydrate ABC transporter membrane protein 2 (CUT1 family) [Rhodobacter aestuarii]|uniref:Carbohydrate ABC transporter membrane protein 2, CUT1 family n=1 Tax=Rhodobacter aestuarii TaxID=453582 RepID=A0A1N7JU01_9RHOB|nr:MULTISPECIES: carbohydrate ABC transporter permease [Rhodobacter]PTV95990.1 carbohydrate ABC transporter membrane protein 2 (CUT1 family) [Rhodobacter aestuarii]SIS52807.1 carbohydrate ABC transporter membrane protein 2, CUT1 family [Rhodobacter aestuarii]SOC10390.1 carbohydrate ABC transporter membrane protein 2 (CUT1 family) [Rhodobacter sp. JA431]
MSLAPAAPLRPARVLRYAAAIFVCVLFTVPLLVTLNTAFKTPAELTQVLSLPSEPTLENFRIAVAEVGPAVLNSLMITIPSVVLSVLIGAMAAYPLSMMDPKKGRWIYFLLLSGMFVPFQIVQIPVFFVTRAIGVYNTIPGLWLVHVAYGVPICTFFMRNFFATVPRSIYEAAQVDGCGPAGYFFKILMPASFTGIAALAIVQSRSVWNDLLFAMTLTASDDVMPVTAKLNGFVGAIQVQHGPLMASAILTVLPMLLAFLLFQKAFVRGLLGGSSK